MALAVYADMRVSVITNKVVTAGCIEYFCLFYFVGKITNRWNNSRVFFFSSIFERCQWKKLNCGNDIFCQLQR